VSNAGPSSLGCIRYPEVVLVADVTPRHAPGEGAAHAAQFQTKDDIRKSLSVRKMRGSEPAGHLPQPPQNHE
jgi:hypothetical protein